MKKRVATLVSILFITTLFTSCKSDERECPVDEPTKTELLTQAVWIGNEAIEYVNDIETNRESITNFSLAFLTNFDVIYYQNGEADDLTQWQFLNNEQTINFIGDSASWDIDTLSETDLIISQTGTSGSGDIEKTIISLNH